MMGIDLTMGCKWFIWSLITKIGLGFRNIKWRIQYIYIYIYNLFKHNVSNKPNVYINFTLIYKNNLKNCVINFYLKQKTHRTQNSVSY